MLFDFDRDTHKLLFVLIITDVFFILFHLLHAFADTLGFFYSPGFDLTQERGYAEIFEYLKEYWTALLLLVLAIRTSNLLYFCWGLLFGYFLVDDSLKIHKNLGAHLSSTFGSDHLFGLDAQMLGELSVIVFFGFLFLFAIGVSYYVNTDDDAKKFSRYVFVLFGVFMFFGMGLGIFQKLTPNHPHWQFSLKLLEEGGELVSTSLIFWFVFRFKPDVEE